MTIEIRSLHGVEFSDIESLFGKKDGCRGCWCMNHHFKEGTAPAGEDAREQLQIKINNNEIDALVAFEEGKPVGWCAIDLKSKLIGHDCSTIGSNSDSAWAIHCLFVKKESRGKAISRILIEAAVDYAKAQGAGVVEGYPFKIPAGKRIKDSMKMFSGPYHTYEKLGFKEGETIDEFYTLMSLNTKT